MKNLIITLTILLIFSVSSMGQYTQVKDHTLHVKGSAILKQVPGLIYASISIKSWSRDYSDCQNKLISKMEKIKSSLVKQDIIKDLIKMDGITVNI